MKPQTEFRKVLVVWAILVGLVIAGMVVGKWMWKKREAENRHAARTAVAREALATVTKAIDCVKNGKRDLVSGAIVHSIEAPSEKVCGDAIEPVSNSLTAAAEKLGMKLEDTLSAPYFDDFDDHQQLEELCTWAGSVGAAADQLATRARLPKVQIPPCDLEAHPLELVARPLELGTKSAAVIEAGAELLLQYRDDDENYVISRSTDHETWRAQTMPRRWYAGYAWTDDRFIATVAERPEDDKSPYLVNVLGADGAWVKRARLATPVIDLVLGPKQEVAIVSTDLASEGPLVVLRSSDNGKTFPNQIRVAEPGQHRGFEAAFQPDGTLVALVTSGTSETRFDVVKVGARAAEVLHTLRWANEPGNEQPTLQTCRSGDTSWALVSRQHLARSSDGRTWQVVHHFPHAFEVGELACTADRIAFTTTGEKSTIQVCQAQACAAPIAFRHSDGAAVALRFTGDTLALWLGSRFSEVHLRTGEPAMLAVYRVDGGKLVFDRIHIAETSGKLPVVRDKDGFFQLSDR